MPCQRDASLDGVSASPVCFRGETATLAVEFRLSRYDTSRRLERHQSPVRLDRGDWCGCRLRGGSGCAHTHTVHGPRGTGRERVFRGHTVVDSRTHIDTHTTQALNQKYNARIGFFAAGASARRER